MEQYDIYAAEYFNRRKNLTKFNFNRNIEVPAMLKLIGNVKNKKVLDLGCGFGDHVEKLSKKKPKKIIGIDSSKNLINLAKQKKIKNCEFFVNNLENKLKFENNYFDLVYSSLTLHYIKNLNLLFSEVNRVLKKKGLFIFSTGHPIFNTFKLVYTSDKKGELSKLFEVNYFGENLKEADLGGILKVKLYNYTLETWFKMILKYNFEVMAFVETKPSISLKNMYPEKYRLTTRLPTFIIIKLRKK